LPCDSEQGSGGEVYVCLHSYGPDWNQFASNLTTLDKLIEQDPDCSSWLAEGPGGAQGLAAFLSSGTSDFILAATIIPPPGWTGGPINGSYDAFVENGAPYINAGGGTYPPIIISSSGYSSALAANGYSAGMIVIHEIAHMLGNPDFGYDGGNKDLEDAESAAIDLNCGKVLNKLN
jgi:hypothetical protein